MAELPVRGPKSRLSAGEIDMLLGEAASLTDEMREGLQRLSEVTLARGEIFARLTLEGRVSYNRISGACGVASSTISRGIKAYKAS